MIGVFDSGVGGLTIFKYLLKELPDYNFIYLGDNARAPYGGRSEDVIYSYTCDAVDFLFEKGCSLVVLACNTASARALRKIQNEYLPAKYPGKNVLGVIRPLAEEVSEQGFKRVGVLGTRATIESRVYNEEIEKLNKDIKVFSKSAPLLVPLIEENYTKNPEAKKILKKYLRPLKEKQIEALILGCTHYPFLLDDIKRIMTKRCHVFCPGEIVAGKLKKYLEKHVELGIEKSNKSKVSFYTTDEVEMFKVIGERFLDDRIENIEKVVI